MVQFADNRKSYESISGNQDIHYKYLSMLTSVINDCKIWIILSGLPLSLMPIQVYKANLSFVMINTDAGMKLTINKNSAKWMQLPRDVLVGHGVLEEVGDVCRDLNLKGNALIVTGRTTWNVAGKKVCGILQSMGINAETALTCKATMKDVEKAM